MRRAVLGLGAVAVLGLVGACGTGTPAPTAAPPPVPTSPGPAATVPVTAPATESTPPPSVPIAPPTVFTGIGEGYVHITKPAGTTAVIATITGNAARHHLGVRAVDGNKDDLVQTNDPYSGSTLLDADGGTTTRLYVHAYGSWSITLSDPRSAPVFGHDYSGNGDVVLAYSGGGGTASISGGAAGTHFAVRAYGAGKLSGFLSSGTGPVDDRVRWAAGTALIAVNAVGPWAISVN